jgi:hypothetical protein
LHFLIPAAKHSFVQFAAHLPLWQSWPSEQAPQFKVPLHPLDQFPQVYPKFEQVFGVQVAMQVPFVQICPPEHFEELSTQAVPAALQTLHPWVWPGTQATQVPFMQTLPRLLQF